MTSRRDRDRGSAVLETTILVPFVMTLIMLLAQFALAAHAKAVVSGAAQDGANAASARGSSVDVGVGTAKGLMASSGTTLDGFDASGDSNADLVTVHTWADVVSVLPFVPAIRVSSSASALREEWRP